MIEDGTPYPTSILELQKMFSAIVRAPFGQDGKTENSSYLCNSIIGLTTNAT